MAFNEGFNFRATLAYVTDPSDTQFVDGLVTYPQTANGVTFGWGVANLQVRDRNAGVDARLAGHHRIDTTLVTQFQVDLPAAGDYILRWAMGDNSYPGGPMYYRLFDNTTVLYTSSGYSGAGVSTASSDRWIDATGVERTSAADWVSNNASATFTFATTTLLFEIAHASANPQSTPIGHLQIVLVEDTLMGQMVY